MGNKKFKANADGYDYETADRLGYKREDDPSGHLPSLDYKTGMVLKGKGSSPQSKKEWELMLNAETKLGNKIIFNQDDNRYYSVSGDTPSPWLEEAEPLSEFNRNDFNVVGKIWDKLDRSNEDTKKAQKILKDYGLYKGEVDGFYGEKTKTATTNYISKFSGDYMWDSMKSKVESIFD